MNVREEDKRKTSNTTRGLATAAIGLGIGAALYYFLSKGSPHPDSEGATSSGWTHERVFQLAAPTNDSDSYSTISEGTTSDTSIHDRTAEFATSSTTESDNDYSTSENDSSLSHNSLSQTSNSDFTSSKTDSTESDISVTSTENGSDMGSDSQSNDEYQSDTDYSESDGEYSDTESDYAETDMSQSDEEDAMDVEISNLFENASNPESLETGYMSLHHVGNSEYDSETAMEWDITNTSLGIPSEERSSSLSNFFGGLTNIISPRKAPQDDRLSKLREQAFRERPWTLEECSICFDVMLRDQEIMTLACTHNFHAQCIMPWLQEKQTCPNCRKHAD